MDAMPDEVSVVPMVIDSAVNQHKIWRFFIGTNNFDQQVCTFQINHILKST
jgi:hypothetical protein